MSGHDFNDSCKDAFFLMKRNTQRFSVLGGIGQMFYLSGVSFISLLTALTGYLLLTNISSAVQNIHSPLVPSLVCLIIGGTVGKIFMSVYSKVADALLVLFTIDEEIQKYHGGHSTM